ncbi:MAG: ATP-binding protein [Anaerolineales bacterium]|jgi:signal transduction histidine kinase
MDSRIVLPVNQPDQRLDRLLEVIRLLGTSPNLETFLDTLIAAAIELTSCEVASILELDESGKHLQFAAAPWFHRELLKGIKVPLENSLAGWVFQNGQPLTVPDVTTDPRHYKGADQAARFTTRSLMAVPIIYHEEKFGVLEVVNKTEQVDYTEEDRLILETLASQAAMAIQNLHLGNKIKISQDQIIQLDRMKSSFIGIASHELRTPLGLILGYATFLREVIQPDYRPQLDIIHRNAMRLKEIIDNLANMDNLQRGVASIRAHQVSIKRLIEEVVDSFQQEANHKRLTLRFDPPSNDLLVEGDSPKISIALSNVVNNAITFTNPGGHIDVVAGPIPGHIKVSVIDDGIGIPADDLPHIFERFYQVESHLTRKHGGMGLGLSVSKVMVEMHGGRIWAESVEGKGSNFTFLLPVKSDRAIISGDSTIPDRL